MALYIGKDKVKINLADGKSYNSTLITKELPLPNGIVLSFDEYILKDLNGLYLITKESE